MAWDYLLQDIPGLIRFCQRTCNVIHEAARPEAQCLQCPKREKIANYSEDFHDYMQTMLDLYDRQQAGWRIRNNDLDLADWRVLARIREFYELKRHENLKALVPPRS